MAGVSETGTPRWRLVLWGGAAALLLLPLLAMQFDAGVNWSAGDFLAFAGLLALAGVAMEVAMRLARTRAGRLGATLTIGALFLLVWVELAVGIVGPG